MERKRILFIDDDPDYVESIKLFLEKKYDLTTSLSAEEGWKKIGEEKPDLILLDAMMPEKDGFTLAKELKKHSTYKSIPLIMLTAVATKITESKYTTDDVLRFGGEDFVEKSAGIEEILSVIDRHME